MELLNTRRLLITAFTGVALLVAAVAQAADPLSSWNDTDTKKAIISFVEKTTSDSNSADYVAPEDRIVTFDNDGTLWVEHPMYTQLAFALDRVKKLAPQHPEWKTTQPFKAVLDNDMKALGAAGEKGLLELVMASHAGMSTADFEKEVSAWFATAKHPRFKRPYTDLTYLPMVELLEYLRANGFKTYIVSGGGIEFMRPMTQAVYGIPPEQVIGSSNSDGDRQMLEWTGAGDGLRLMGLVYHDDAEREYAYGPAGGLPSSPFGTFSQSTMDEAKKNGWQIISMKNDWARIFAFDE